VTERARAKVNLYLHVVGRRSDGYHELDSLVVFPDASDRLSASPANHVSLTLTGPFSPGLSNEPDNLVLRAARALAKAAGVQHGARLTLAKNLPIASGIGGGSADAAAALRLLTRMWNLSITQTALAELAVTLGADIPACLRSTPLRMGGIGERLQPAPRLPPYALLLVNPGVAVATVAVFQARHGKYSVEARLPEAWPDAEAMARDLTALTNDLEAPAVSLCPVIADVLAAIKSQPGCLLARMSGSGATCFGLFAASSHAALAATVLRRTGWWCWSSETPPA
jgi:4-diphosphocytidyl-2-C-methyl-D-erythritol kinase